MADFRRMHWKLGKVLNMEGFKPFSKSSSITVKQMAQRVSMIVGVDKRGNIYLCLTQSNSNRSIMSLFMQELVKKLDRQNEHWRNSTVIQWDGASYHKSKATMQMLERLRVPITMSGPYSFDTAVAELFFSKFKADDINPNAVPVSNTHFLQVVHLVI